MSLPPMPVPRRLSLAAAACCCVSLLAAGCSGGGTTTSSAEGTKQHGTAAGAAASAAAGFDLDAALDRAKRGTRESATVDVTTQINGLTVLRMSGRGNLNGRFTGTFTMTMELQGQQRKIETVLTEQGGYVRADLPGSESGWQRVPPEDAIEGAAVTDFSSYAALLAAKPGARKGAENRDGVRVFRLSGPIAAEELRSVDSRVYRRLKAQKVSTFDCDIWIGQDGRVTRFEQRMRIAQGEAHNVMTLTGFGPPVTVQAPVG